MGINSNPKEKAIVVNIVHTLSHTQLIYACAGLLVSDNIQISSSASKVIYTSRYLMISDTNILDLLRHAQSKLSINFLMG